MSLYGFALLQMEIGQNKEAERAFTEAMEIFRKQAETDPDTYLPKLVKTLENLIIVKEKLSKTDEVVELKKELAKMKKGEKNEPESN